MHECMEEFVMTKLGLIANLVEDGPWCGRRGPGPRPPRVEEFALAEQANLGSWSRPQPPPWTEVEAAFWQSVRLYQVGHRIQQLKSGAQELGAKLTAAASAFFDDGCRSAPWSVIVSWLSHPPPPRPPWRGPQEPSPLRSSPQPWEARAGSSSLRRRRPGFR
jgi:hypothetical protein